MTTIEALRGRLERAQIPIYIAAVCIAAATATAFSGTNRLESAINPALALMLFVTFLQVPLTSLGEAFRHRRFFAALLATNFVAIPLFVAVLIQFAPQEPLLRFGILLVLLCPCIDYVVTFSHLGRADARLMLAATPVLLIVQILLLPFWLGVFMGADAARLVHAEPFLHAFLWLIAIPFGFAALCQFWAASSAIGAHVTGLLSLLPVLSTAAVLFIVIAAVLPQIGPATTAVFAAAPLYVAFAAIAPLTGWTIARFARLEAPAGRAVAFSCATRNSLVILPLALAAPGAIPLLPAVVVTQTLVELVASLIYIRLMPQLKT